MRVSVRKDGQNGERVPLKISTHSYVCQNGFIRGLHAPNLNHIFKMRSRELIEDGSREVVAGS